MSTLKEDLDTLYARRQGCRDPECSVCQDNARIYARLSTVLNAVDASSIQELGEEEADRLLREAEEG